MNISGHTGPPACHFDAEKLLLEVDTLMPSRVEAISPAVDKLMNLLKRTCCAPEQEFAVETALREALANAVIHGNRQDPGKNVSICCACQEDRGILIVVKDEGEGFDPAGIPSPLTATNLSSDHGRGIYLISLLMDEVRFARGGTEIYIRKAPPGNAPRAAKQAHRLTADG